jgi:RHS repeat-associated protein
VQIGGSSYDNRFLFTGREFLGVWYEYRARTYHPLLGRFMSEDPKLFDAGDYNLYRYCHNDPLDLTDPMGLDTEAELRYYIMGHIPLYGDYGHQNLVLRDTTSGRMLVERGFPGEPYNNPGWRSASNLPQKSASGSGNVPVRASIFTASDTTDPMKKGQGTKAVPGSKVILKDSIDTLKSKLDKLNDAINRANIDYRLQTTNSNAVAGTGYKEVTGQNAPSLPQLPGSNINLKNQLPQPPPPPPIFPHPEVRP